MSAEHAVEAEQPIPSGADEQAAEPVTAPAEAPVNGAHQDSEQPAQEENDQSKQGLPAGQLAAGGLSATTAVLTGLYQLAGPWGLAAGGIAAGGGALAYLRRRRRDRTARPLGVSGSSGAGRRGASRTGGTGNASFGSVDRTGGLLGYRSRSGARSAPLMSTAPGTGRMRTARAPYGASSATPYGGAARPSKRSARTGKTGRAGSPSAGRRSRRDRTGHRAHTVRRAAGGAVRATRRGARTVGGAVRATGRGARRAGAWADRATGHRASRAFAATGRGTRRTVAATGRGMRRAGRAARRHAGRAGAWADRRTGRRVSTAWAAARTARTFRSARRAALAARSGARRWDAEMTAGLVALVAWLTGWWRHRESRNAKPDTTTENAPGDATETTSKVSDDGDPALTGSAECPRCGTKHTATIPSGEQEIWVTCPCGFTIRLYRAPNDPPDSWDKSAGQAKSAATGQDRRRHPYTAPTTTYRRTRTMSTFPLAATAAEMNAAAASHAPADMWVVSRELDQLTEVPAYVALAIRTYTARLQAEYPIHPAVVEAIHRLYQGQAQLVALAEEIGPLFRQAHAEDLKREEAPRINEPLWNV